MQEPFVDIPEETICEALEVVLGRENSEIKLALIFPLPL